MSKVRRIPVRRLVFMDESGLNLSMTRSHAWVKKGTEFTERTPMNWGKNLTLLGAIRLTGWVVLNSMFATANKERFVLWLKRKLLPKLTRGDVLVLDNLNAHHDPRVAPACAAHGVALDVPSGVDATTGNASGEYIHAHTTMTLALPKTGLSGQLVLADIGIPEGVYRKLGLGYSTPFDRRSRVPLRRLP